MQIGGSSPLTTEDDPRSILQLAQTKYGGSLEESGDGRDEGYEEGGCGEG